MITIEELKELRELVRRLNKEVAELSRSLDRVVAENHLLKDKTSAARLKLAVLILQVPAEWKPKISKILLILE